MFDPSDLKLISEPAWTAETPGMTVGCIAYSPDGSQVAFSSSPNEMVVKNVINGEDVQTLQQSVTSHPLISCFFHPIEEDFLFTIYKDGHMFLYDMQTNEVLKTSRHLGSNISCADVDPFGEIFAIACSDGSIRIYDIEYMQRTTALVKISGHSGNAQSNQIFDLIFNPDDSNILLSAVGNDKVMIWDRRSGNSEKTISGPHIRGRGLAMYNNTITTASSRQVKQLEVWDFNTTRRLKDIQICGSPNCVAVAKNGVDMIVGMNDSTVGLAYDAEKYNFIGSTQPLKSNPSYAAVSPIGTTMVIGSEQGAIHCYNVKLIGNVYL
ncbi:hypothetical protein TVAG_209260 [Trichomonas vaginalis G3]|uniref:Uncharacterized protein n=1 Tax=Trichomonas vaginalis (strain ATCC PRA-98 / G3) TaxID=412133 RepID=A2DVG8_TRIV3|nr:hypothetical protein TVAG_209260 [Trichomonas vaginalis G3]|eukprot:XP_001327870.1 hypothetical protein [Trichomonas vaginalis G3]